LHGARNKVSGFTAYYDDYDDGGQKNESFDNTDISFSPEVVGSYTVNLMAGKKSGNLTAGEIRVASVSRQHIEQSKIT
jgi:hypothetical protein